MEKACPPAQPVNNRAKIYERATYICKLDKEEKTRKSKKKIKNKNNSKTRT